MFKTLRRLPILKALCMIFAGLIIALLLSVALKTNNLEEPLNLNRSTMVMGPFESSNTTSRFALVESIVKQSTFFFDLDLARFAVPDVVENNGKFYTSFTPGISFVAVPFYILGQYLGLTELITLFSTVVFATLNGFALYFLGKKIGASTPAANGRRRREGAGLTPMATAGRDRRDALGLAGVVNAAPRLVEAFERPRLLTNRSAMPYDLKTNNINSVSFKLRILFKAGHNGELNGK